VGVVEDCVGEADAVGSEGDGGVVADPVAAWLLEQVDGGVEVRERDRVGWDPRGDAVSYVEDAEGGDRGAEGLMV